MNAAELTRYITSTWDTDCTIAQYAQEMELNEALKRIYALGSWRGVPPKFSPDTPEARERVRRALLVSEGKRAGREFMRRHAQA